jgi:hypothetical protein
MQKYNKTFVAVVGAALTWAIANFAGDPDVSKWLSFVSAVLTAAGVYRVPNEVEKRRK